MNVPIFSSELIRNGIPPQQWNVLNFHQRVHLARKILSQRGDARSRQVAFLLEINNPNAMSALHLVLDSPNKNSRLTT